ncbi:four helix bundle protein [Ancylomarina sp. 16SWW S1-10-2]|uniref:four helix bundle protein n=1 Tax=Ancylomarina sp. 16SWW S1-10-2 TaxID=2499681 RepID=UPI0012AEA822|nr:four helix bundle protein [Ancylomarina sp. 16SWW S1-10-2]MRT93235.1 four helix bundle protein [Ancylomarina sp. 16SWW S1-10-2]
MGSFDFENLNLYQKSLEFINLVYKQTNTFPRDEIYGLTSQYRRAANSIALNLGEGYGESVPLNIRYLRISKGSVRECVVCSSIALSQGYISITDNREARELLIDLSKMASGYKKYLEKKLVEIKNKK